MPGVLSTTSRGSWSRWLPTKTRGFAGTSLLIAALLGPRCSGPTDEPARREALLETVDVGEGSDMAIQPDDDQQAMVASGDGLIGVLPGDFPLDLPIYTPSSLVDFGEIGPGLKYITLQIDGSQADVHKGVARAFASGGWHPVTDQPDIFRKDDRQVRVRISEGSFDTTEVQIDYPTL